MKQLFSVKRLSFLAAILAVVIFGFLAVSGCSVTYVWHVGWGQLDIMRSTAPVEEIMSDPSTGADIKEKLRIILEAKRYGEESIGLARTDSYTAFVALDRPVASWNLMAAPKLKLEPVTWRFPIVGRMPYLGYFSKKKALKKESRLRRKGYDTYLRGAAAYSTLGWFKDPVFSPLLRYDISTLVNITIHELTHTTVFLKGHVAYNEGMALFVGNQGSLDFLSKKYGPDSEYVQAEKDNIQNDRVFSAFLQKLHDKLRKHYDSDMTDDEKMKGREKIFTEAKEEFKRLPLRGKAYRSFIERELNNAAILSRSIYFVDIDMYQQLYETLGRDLKKTVEFFVSLDKQKAEDPEKFTRKFIEEHKK